MLTTAAEPGANTRGRCDLLAAGKPIGIVRPDVEVLQHTGVGGDVRVQMRIAPEHPLREGLIDVGGILALNLAGLGDRHLGRCDLGRHCGLGRHQRWRNQETQ